MSDPAAIMEDLRAHLALCEELLRLATRENQRLRAAEAGAFAEWSRERRRLLPQLDATLAKVKARRLAWQRRPATAPAPAPELPALIRSIQDVIMKILVLDRENEQTLLRLGLVPVGQLPQSGRQRPHFVAELYRRHHPG